MYFPTKILKPEGRSWCGHFPLPPLEKLVLKAVQWSVNIIVIIIIIIIIIMMMMMMMMMMIIIIIVVVVFVAYDNYYWVYLSSEHPS